MVSGKCFKFLSHIISRKLAIAIIVLFVSFIGSFGIFIFQAGAGTGAPQILNYQGRLLDSSGNLIGTSSGTEYCFRFSFYTDATVGGTPETKLWPTDTPSNMTVNVKDGIFSVGIGDTSVADEGDDLSSFDFESNDTIYLNVSFAAQSGESCAGVTPSETFGPRQRVFSSGYAINSNTVGGFSPAQSATGNQIPVLTSDNLILGSGGLTAKGFSTFTFAGTENLTITFDLVGTADIISLAGTPSGTAGTARGIFIQQANHATNTNGLDVGLLFNNADTDLAFTDGIVFTNFGGGGFTNFFNTPSIDITGEGAITGATSITISGGDLALGGGNVSGGGVIFLIEQANADADVAGSGQLWVETVTPNILRFTDDAGTDFTVAHNATATLNSLTSATSLAWTGMTTGTDGQIPTFDATGAPAFVATGNSGEVLTSNGVGTAPTFQAAPGGGNVSNTGTPVDNQLAVWTNATTIEGTADFTFDGADFLIYNAVNDGNPEIRLGATDLEELNVQTVFDAVAQTLDYVLFNTSAASVTADKGEYRFQVDDALVATVDVGGTELADAMAYFIDTSNVLSETVLGVSVLASSLTSVGTLGTLTVDDITLNANAISSAGASSLAIIPTAGQAILLDGTISIDAGVVTGATSITSTTFVGALTGTASGNLVNVVEDTTPQLGGALDGQGFDLNNMGVLFLTEQAAAEVDVAGKGQLWVETLTPNILRFTDDAGTDFTIAHNATATLNSLTSATSLAWTGMTTGTDGQIPTFDATGAPAFVATGNSGEVLTSNGVGTAPTFQAAPGGGNVSNT